MCELCIAGKHLVCVCVLDELFICMFSHRFVGLLLACMFGCSARVSTHLHMHGIDDVKEVFDHCYTFQGGVVLGRTPVRTLKHREGLV